MDSSKILFTGGNGHLCSEFKKQNNPNFIFLSKEEMDITDCDSLDYVFRNYQFDYVIHTAALTRPMILHDENPSISIDINIIGTANIVKACQEENIKLIYFSTHYVYPGKKGNYSEKDPVLPFNNYAISKLGGECSVQMYSNSLILRICMTEKPFIHKKAFDDVEQNFIFHDSFAQNLLKLIDLKGIINVGGNKKTVFKFARQFNKNIDKISAKKMFGKNYPLKHSIKTDLYKKAIKQR